MIIRRATLNDLPAMTEIYNYYVVNSPVTFDLDPFTADERKTWFAQFGESGRYQLFVAEQDDRVIGYGGSMRHRGKSAYDVSIETTIYVAVDAPRLGAGRGLYERLFEALKGEDVRRAFAGVVVPNEASVNFHKALGFSEIGVFHEIGRKFGRYHDVLWLEKRL